MFDGDPLHCPMLPLHPLPRLTADLPGIGGQLRVFVEDFEVEEIPLYEPAGVGDHLYLWIEKIDVAADTLRRHVARALDIPGGDVGMAGMKDRRAITRQWLSVPRSCEARLDRINSERIRVLDSKLHRNKLRTAHLTGNRFRIRLRGTVPEAEVRAAAKIERLLQFGMPNLYGAQRMGHGGSTLAAGWALTRGAKRLTRVRTPDDTVHALNLSDRPLRRLAASAVQGEVFNRTVARRLAEGVFARVLDGDVCKKSDTGGTFVTDDFAREQRRLEAGELGITGPMWGSKMIRALREAALLEAAVLAELGLDEAGFAELGSLAEGTRRVVAVRPENISLHAEDDGLTVAFSLPAGAFATVFIHELAGPLTPEEAQALAPVTEPPPDTSLAEEYALEPLEP